MYYLIILFLPICSSLSHRFTSSCPEMCSLSASFTEPSSRSWVFMTSQLKGKTFVACVICEGLKAALCSHPSHLVHCKDFSSRTEAEGFQGTTCCGAAGLMMLLVFCCLLLSTLCPLFCVSHHLGINYCLQLGLFTPKEQSMQGM